MKKIEYWFKRIFSETWVNYISRSKSKSVEPFSVIIPTIWRSDLINELVWRLSESIWVSEIILIDNLGKDGKGLAKRNKVKVYSSKENLYVNPSWNLGVEMASCNNIAICNDDILFDCNILPKIAAVIKNKNVGIIGIHKSIHGIQTKTKFHLRYMPYRENMFGILMFMRKEKFSFIPEELKIWSGDEYLFQNVLGQHFGISGGMEINNKMSASSGSVEFREIKLRDKAIFESKYQKR